MFDIITPNLPIMLSPSLPQGRSKDDVVARLDTRLWCFSTAPPCKRMETSMGRLGAEPFQSSAIPLVESLFPAGPGRSFRYPLVQPPHYMESYNSSSDCGKRFLRPVFYYKTATLLRDSKKCEYKLSITSKTLAASTTFSKSDMPPTISLVPMLDVKIFPTTYTWVCVSVCQHKTSQR